MKKIVIGIVAVFALCWFVAPASATLLTGEINDLESSSPFFFGDGTNDISLWWTPYSGTGGSGYFYGTIYYPLSNADIYVYSELTDPTTVSDASLFS